MASKLPSMAEGLSWWSTMAVVPHSSASRAPSRAEALIMSRSRATSRRHHTCSRICRKLAGRTGGAGIPLASDE